jgi:hypothetical protein
LVSTATPRCGERFEVLAGACAAEAHADFSPAARIAEDGSVP